jgi:hypothetical protein
VRQPPSGAGRRVEVSHNTLMRADTCLNCELRHFRSAIRAPCVESSRPDFSTQPMRRSRSAITSCQPYGYQAGGSGSVPQFAATVCII